MATEAHLNRLNGILDEYRSIERSEIDRSRLGESSLKEQMNTRFISIDELTILVEHEARSVHDSFLSLANETLQNILNTLVQHSGRTDSEFLNEKDTFLQNMDKFIEDSKKWTPYFIVASVAKSGILDDENIRQQYEKTSELFQNESSAAIKKLQEETGRILEEAKKQAEQIETRARRTATGISVKDAQQQFAEAQKGINLNLIGWGVASVAALSAFIVVVNEYLGRSNNITSIQEAGESVFWYTIISNITLRVLIISAIGTVATFCIRTFRAYLHMSTLNKHRQRVANCIEAFVESANTPEQRDMILANLVGSVIAFGNSGLLPNDNDSLAGQKLSNESLAQIASKVIGS